MKQIILEKNMLLKKIKNKVKIIGIDYYFKIKIMKDAQKVIKRDPDLMNVMQIKIDEADIQEYEKGYYEANHPGEEYAPQENKEQS